ncbi:FAD-dependent oxidoreductase (plasmid) [Rhodococcus sp. USK10]|uniref:NAD(P)/FAD-dependent oxidoreductase n=1 Tax=Rhodococcus sp. USK10 TaxID=2789739 RepID=UPI001C5D8BCB|nr:FAD-dependent oxidoreductase [Rhodococcus sp. USK10]QYB00552.1 FAD-dependent oxidoreductase [Rhodococcus sp. USK10]
MSGTALIVGSSVAGIRTAQSLRTEGWLGRIIVVGGEPHLPYDRPPLSKHMLTDRTEISPTPLLTKHEATSDTIELLLGTPAVALDTTAKRVALANHREVPYDHLIIATGASARPSPWGQMPGLHVLRGLDDCLGLRKALHGDASAGSGHLVVIGAGFIGSEVAAAARALNLRVSIVAPSAAPLVQSLGSEVGMKLTELHQRHSVETYFGCAVSSLTSSTEGIHVLLDNGTELSATSVVVGIGATPNVEWLTDSGLTLGDGVMCDEQGRASGRPDISAVGDVACWTMPQALTPRRGEHWTRAVEQANLVSRRLCGNSIEDTDRHVDYVWSDLHDWKIQIVGQPRHGCQSEIVGEFNGAHTKVAVLYSDEEQRLVGGFIVNWPRATILLRKATEQRSNARAARADRCPHSAQLRVQRLTLRDSH